MFWKILLHIFSCVRRLGTGRIKVWSCDIIVDWADPQEEPDEDTMAKVKVLYCRNLTLTVTEDSLRELFERFLQRLFNYFMKMIAF